MDEAPDMGASPNWADLAERARRGQFYSGTVTATDVGLYAGIPFTLLQVRVAESSSDSAPPFVYVLYPNASVTIEGVRYCTRPLGYVGTVEQGDRIFFLASQSVDQEGTLFRVGAERLFVQHGTDLVVPPHLKGGPVVASARTIRDLEQKLMPVRAVLPR